METKTNLFQPVQYVPYEERKLNTQYQDLLSLIMDKGQEKFSPYHKQNKRRISGAIMRFPMAHGFPLITEREMKMRGAIGEIIAFANGARTLDEMEKFGCPKKFWEKWVTPEKCAQFGFPPGDLGTGSYGPAWTRFPTDDGRFFNQIENLQRQLKESPNVRTNYLMPLIPYMTCTGNEEFPRKVVVAPCHGNVQIDADSETKTMHLIHTQASGDVPVGLPNNMSQYAALGMMLASVIRYSFVEYVHIILDAHIYECQYPYVEEMLTRSIKKLPTVIMTSTKERIEDYRPTDFSRTDYNPHPAIDDIPTPV